MSAAKTRRTVRRASVYIIVLGTALLVTVIGLSALTSARIERESSAGAGDLAAARFYAQSALQVGLNTIASDTNWRNVRPNGTWLSNVAIGDKGGSFTLLGVDPGDANLGNGQLDPLQFTAIGSQGAAQYKLRVTLNAVQRGVGGLEVALHAGGDMTFSGMTVNCDQTISANGNVSASAGSRINCDVEAGGIITGGGGQFGGTRTSGITPRSMPDSTAFDTYIASGTTIALAALPRVDLKGMMEDFVLSPTSNPFGARTLNAQGIYVIQCGDGDIEIRNGRIVGTLVLIDPGPASRINKSVNWEAAVANYPALLVRGNFTLKQDAKALSETARGINFNPPGTPYGSIQDSDTRDIYPSRITGLVYISGNVDINKNPVVDGVLLAGGSITGTGALDLTYESKYWLSPPPGFEMPPVMQLAAGTFQQIVN